MTRTGTNSKLRTAISEMAKQKSARFALLAKVGVRKREALALQEEATFYFSTVTDLLALSTELVTFLQRAEEGNPHLRGTVAESTYALHHSLKRLLHFCPRSSDSQERLYALLNSAGLATMMDTTADGYLSLSSDQILGNVARVIEVTKEENRKVSFTSVLKRLLASAGTSGREPVTT